MKSEAYLWMAVFLLAGVWIGFKDGLTLSALSGGGGSNTNNFVFSQPQNPNTTPYPQQNWQNPGQQYAPYGQQAEPNPQYQNTTPNTGYGYNQPPSGQYRSPQTNRRPCNKTVRYHYQGL